MKVSTQARRLADSYTLPILLVVPSNATELGVKMEGMLNAEYGLVKTALLPKVHEGLGPVVSVCFTRNPGGDCRKKHFVLALTWDAGSA
jgi:hypothetical protein